MLVILSELSTSPGRGRVDHASAFRCNSFSECGNLFVGLGPWFQPESYEFLEVFPEKGSRQARVLVLLEDDIVCVRLPCSSVSSLVPPFSAVEELSPFLRYTKVV